MRVRTQREACQRRVLTRLAIAVVDDNQVKLVNLATGVL